MQRGHIERIDAGLRGVRGAQDVIAAITSRRTVSKLILGHNELGDEGCTLLFQFLASAVGRTYPIREISLNANGIGDAGLLAISAYLLNNMALKELFLQNNAFSGQSAVISAFTKSLNTSRLEILSLTTNRQLSDAFIQTFIPSLNSTYLREMHLSAIDMTPRSASYLTAYIASKRCRLHILKCNGNSLGYRGVRSIIRAIVKSNYSLTTVELYSNQMNQETHTSMSDSSDTESDANPTHLDAWKDTESRILRVLTRNRHLKRETEKQAFELLRCSRVLLLPSRSGSSFSPFTAIPTELQHYILSFLAPNLSSSQRIAIFAHASSMSTLPQLLPPLWQWSGHGSGFAFYHSGKCLATLSRREQDRLDWLEIVGCAVYDPS